MTGTFVDTRIEGRVLGNELAKGVFVAMTIGGVRMKVWDPLCQLSIRGWQSGCLLSSLQCVTAKIGDGLPSASKLERNDQ